MMEIVPGTLLQQIESPADLKKLSRDQLQPLVDELRQYIIDVVSVHGGHFGASLGVVELTVALHYIYNTPFDQLVWDVGHQAYGHKILTGRRESFISNRKYQGLSGFPKRSESEYDTFGVGHSSTSISAALGMAMAAKSKGENRKSVAIIGDGAMTAGQAFEAMNHTGVADTDMLTDRLWVQVQQFFGQRLLSAFANNADFVINALDNLTGSSDLIGMRSRATYTRPFERVEELRRKSDADFRTTEQSLQDQLTETERKLTELQSQRKDGENLMILSDEQRQEIERFQQQKLEIRKELRQVRRNLLSDIDNLGTWLKVINVMLVPLLVALLALGVFVMRNRRRSAT